MKTVLYLLVFLLSFQLYTQDNIGFDLLWEENIFPRNPYIVVFDKMDRPYFYVANDSGGLRIYNYDSNSEDDPIEINSIEINQWDGMKVMKLSQRDEFLFLALGTFFGGGSGDFGMAIVNILDPKNAYVTDFWKSSIPSKGSAIVEVKGDHAFLGAMNYGLVILNISDPEKIILEKIFKPDPNFPVNNPNATQEPNVRGMAINGDIIYLCYDAGGISVVDISDISNPVELDRYINEELIGVTQQAYNNILIKDDLAYVATDYCGMEIIDISIPTDIKRIGWWNPWNCESPNNFWLNSDGHTNEIQLFNEGLSGNIILMNANDQEMVALDSFRFPKPYPGWCLWSSW